MATHLFNAMAPFGHRNPGLVGVALTDARVVPSVIADGVHVDPLALRLAFAAASDVVLVTDSVGWRAGGLADGTPALERAIGLGADGAPRLGGGSGVLAGSALTMDRAVAFVAGPCGVELGRALASASTVPARVLGLTDRGMLALGRRADIVALQPGGRVEATWVGGEIVYDP